MGLIEISATADANAAEHTYRNAQDKKIVIKANSKGDNATEISVRVGKVGDNDLPNSIMVKVKKQLS